MFLKAAGRQRRLPAKSLAFSAGGEQSLLPGAAFLAYQIFFVKF
jgi:hypothetical protein